MAYIAQGLQLDSDHADQASNSPRQGCDIFGR